ncbi:hypothetical protein H6784_04750 [Candidatus Nomurabacteria bacterium]|nr:hypothetical protein [Candidatus Kaiserbacteria bacterium]MCB9814698.1 hypothetical protein [Candidatus Nomurabacteria bacterium]
MSDNKQGKTRQSPFVKFLVRSASGWPGVWIGAIFIFWGFQTFSFWTVGAVSAALLTFFLSYSFGEIVIKPEEFLDRATEDPFYYKAVNAEGLLYKSKGQSAILKVFNRWAEPVQQELEEWIRKQKARELLSEMDYWSGLDDRLDGVIDALALDPTCLDEALVRVQSLIRKDTERQKQLLDAHAVRDSELSSDNRYVQQAREYISANNMKRSIASEAETMLRKIEERLAVYEKTGTYPAWE